NRSGAGASADGFPERRGASESRDQLRSGQHDSVRYRRSDRSARRAGAEGPHCPLQGWRLAAGRSAWSARKRESAGGWFRRDSSISGEAAGNRVPWTPFHRTRGERSRAPHGGHSVINRTSRATKVLKLTYHALTRQRLNAVPYTKGSGYLAPPVLEVLGLWFGTSVSGIAKPVGK